MDGSEGRGPWLLRCVAGLGSAMAKELLARRVISRKTPLHWVRQRDHDLLFLSRGVRRPPGTFLRLPEMGLRCLAYGRYKISKSQLDALAAELGGDETLQLAVNAAGSHFDRRDLRRWLGRRLGERGVATAADGARTLWVFCIDASYYLGVELFSEADSPLRNLRLTERHGSLPPTIAAAMVFLAELDSDELVVDPVCGSGTLLAETFAVSPDSKLIGFDIDGTALQAAAVNLRECRRLLLARADGAGSPLKPGLATLVLANLPFGKQFGDREENPKFYGGLLREMERISRPPFGRALLLTSDTAALEAALADSGGLRGQRVLRVKVRGEWAEAWKVDRRAES